jgi:hypothetical protein
VGLSASVVRGALASIMAQVPDAAVTVRYEGQTIPALRNTLTADRVEMTYGAAYTYAFSVYIARDKLRGQIERNTRMTVDKTEYMVIGVSADPLGAFYRVSLGEKNQ